jgi:hypothetical protein
MTGQAACPRLEQSICSPVSGGRRDAGRPPSFSQSGLAKSPCRGFATRSLTGAGMPTPVLFCQGEDVGLLSSGADGPAAATSKGHMNGFFRLYQGARFRLTIGDITRLKVDEVVNAANTSLLGGGGVDGCPSGRRARASRQTPKSRGMYPGRGAAYRGHRSPASHVIHAVGPIWQGGAAGEQQILESFSCLEIALAEISRYRVSCYRDRCLRLSARSSRPRRRNDDWLISHRTAAAEVGDLCLLRHANFERLPRCGRLWSVRMSCARCRR